MCFPTVEALAAGLTVVMPDVAPNRMWPVRLVKANPTSVRTVAKFPIPAVDVDVDDLTVKLADIDEWGNDHLADRVAWLEANSWDTQAAVWLQALEEAANEQHRTA